MIAVNRDKLKAEYRADIKYVDGLESYLTDVALAKPLLTYDVDDMCISTERTKDANGDLQLEKQLYRIKVYGAGEYLGDIGIIDRWRGGNREKAYLVECFRINKGRGRQNGTTTIDPKTALREAKKAFNPRQDDELKTLIKNMVKNQVNTMMDQARSYLRWNFEQDAELCNYAIVAFNARKNGDLFAKMPIHPLTVKDTKEHDIRCEKFINSKELFDALKANQGYGIRANIDNTLVVYNYATDTVGKVNSYDDLPESIQSKFAMFKVLDANDPVGSIGVKLADNYYYVMQ